MLYIVTAGMGWLAAETIKRLLFFAGYNRRALGGYSYSSGGMPSAHTATVSALATIIGATQGLDSPIFAVCIVLAVIVAYDAMTVRFSSGEQGDALNEVISEMHTATVRPVRIAHGHTGVEVLAGAVMGSAVAIVVFFTIK